jgi:hypothetical protein
MTGRTLPPIVLGSRNRVAAASLPVGATDADPRDLCAPRGPEVLDLAEAGLTDDGLRRVGGLRRLRRLRLPGTAVTDAGLRHLEAMGGLEAVHLCACPGVTKEGVERLRKALPGCEVYR